MSIRPTWLALALALPPTGAGCAAPRAARHDLRAAEAALPGRAPEAEVVREALDLAGLDAAALRLPADLRADDPAADGYWRAAAAAFAPGVRAARAAALAALAREDAAGAPGPTELRLVDHEFGGDDVLVESVATFDLVGLLGAGPSRAARGLARRESLRALAGLADALWEAGFAVDHARVEHAAARERAARLAALVEEARADLGRVDVLAANGRLGAAVTDAARGQVRATELARDVARERVVARAAALAHAAGLPLERVVAAGPGAPTPPPVARTLDPEHPRLVAARLDLAVAEARLRRVAADAWPGLRLGPHLGWPSGDLDPTRVGGVLSLSLPWPASYEGRLEAAAVERDRTIERYAEAVLALRTDLEAAAEAARLAAERADAARAVDAATAGAWRATRAAFRAGRADLGAWMDALDRRRAAVNVAVDADRDRAVAALEAARAAGPAAVRGGDLPEGGTR